ncbi:hypothetical protein [Salipiger sp. CCB-MM3]|uniref:hypothetical protein n=1 Tax=Salipiger sp. CCB-MM3 TaxID=1792508 RepID=UPI00187D9DB2|nr:hypothetical protein [Salipiger sp. CCB-MM3]
MALNGAEYISIVIAIERGIGVSEKLMERIWVFAAVAALLAGCGATSDSDDDCVRDNPLQECQSSSGSDDGSDEDDSGDGSTEGGTDGDSGSGGSDGGAAGGDDVIGGTPTTMEEIEGAVASFSFASDMSALTVQINGLDSSPVSALYERNDRLTNVMGLEDYVAYSVQEDPLDRFFLALGGMSTDGSVSAVAVGDGGQFNTVFQDGYYRRVGAFDPPDFENDPASGQVSYVGNYAAVTNVVTREGLDLKPVGTLPDDYAELDQPGQPVPMTGVIFLNVNFAEAALNGQILNRKMYDPRDAQPQGVGGITGASNIILEEGTIDEIGEFAGNGVFEDESLAGTFSGVFGGEGAAYAAGNTELSWSISSLFGEEGDYDVKEVGMFVLTQCGKSGAREDICSLVDH